MMESMKGMDNMFGSTHNGANAYAAVGVETGVSSASAHELIVMLFDGALIALTTAQQHMKAGNIPGKGQAISKAIMIIDSGLRASLNKEVGGEIAQNLDALYQYMSTRLVIANVKNQPEILVEVHGLLKDLKTSWEAIGVPEKLPAPVQVIPKAPAYDSLEPNASRLVKA
jgi:flagellar protein FliS